MLLSSLALLLLALTASGSMIDVNSVLRSSARGGFVYMENNAPAAFGPAFRFAGNGVCLNQQTSARIVDFIRSNCEDCYEVAFRILLARKQNIGTVLSIRSGRQVVMDIAFRRNVQLQIQYLSRTNEVSRARFFYEFDVNTWHSVVLRFCPMRQTISLFVGCVQIYPDQRANLSQCPFPSAGSEEACVGRMIPGQVWRGDLFGSIQALRFFRRAEGVTNFCNNSKSAREIELEERIARLESELQSCQSHYCKVGSIVYANGSDVPSSRLCFNRCKCINGDVQCQAHSCPQMACPQERQIPANPDLGMCCSTCLPEAPTARQAIPTTPPPVCMMNGESYAVGKVMFRDSDRHHCQPCHCKRAGEFVCEKRTICPRLPSCPRTRRYRPPQTCCEICLDHDICRERRPCGNHAICTNLPNRMYQCRCSPGATINTQTGLCERPAFRNPFVNWGNLFG